MIGLLRLCSSPLLDLVRHVLIALGTLRCLHVPVLISVPVDPRTLERGKLPTLPIEDNFIKGSAAARAAHDLEEPRVTDACATASTVDEGWRRSAVLTGCERAAVEAVP